MRGLTRRLASVIALAVAALAPSTALSVGLSGPSSANLRAELDVAPGVDNVSGYDTAAIPYLEVGARIDARLARRVVAGATFSLRQDLIGYDYALNELRTEHTPALAMQANFGFEPSSHFHFSFGSWAYAEGRNGKPFRLGLIPWPVPPVGILRFRFGQNDGKHLTLTFADGAPFTADGGLAAKMMVGFRSRGASGVEHDRYHAGAYYNLFERTFGLLLHREFLQAPGGTVWRTALQVGTAHQFLFTRFEASLGVGIVFY